MDISAQLEMFRFIQFDQLECVGHLNVDNGRKSLLDLFPDVPTIFDSEVFEANIWTLKTPTRPFLNSSLFWQPPEFGNEKESTWNVNEAIRSSLRSPWIIVIYIFQSCKFS